MYGVAFRGGGVEQDRPGGIAWGNVEVNLGSVLENLFAQQLHANGFALRYYNSKRLGEVDFVIQNGRDITPIEIKSVDVLP